MWKVSVATFILLEAVDELSELSMLFGLFHCKRMC